ncbi:hypothetical protein [Longimicrobium sp.]|uniref:hypothetical protein n=1 Tax=Longimicrobium sp. TaxID=2029185 RepID=UPI002E346168|nr:hypothetical protein [Longimicrobium sp.]HEX6040050.1 hypothetical protein [Longimicrobium sp.]
MNGYDDRQGSGLVQYRGIPNEPNAPGEKGKWQRFLEWSMPWLRHKWALGEAVVAAKAAQEVAKARQMMAEARKAELETLDLARRMEAEKLTVLASVPMEPEDLETEKQALLAKLEMLGWKHGTRIEFDVRASDAEDPVPEADASATLADVSAQVGDYVAREVDTLTVKLNDPAPRSAPADDVVPPYLPPEKS